MAMRWRDFEQVPKRIRQTYFNQDGSAKALHFGGNIANAAITYWDRNTPVAWGMKPRSNGRRRLYPAMGVESRSGHWYPLPQEVASCCKTLKLPRGKAPPWMLKQHCCTIRHVALLYDVDPKLLQEIVNMDLGIVPALRVSRHCKDCGKFALKDSEYCTVHQRIDLAWQEMQKVADEYEIAQLNLLESSPLV